jgi:hypothetical protein
MKKIAVNIQDSITNIITINCPGSTTPDTVTSIQDRESVIGGGRSEVKSSWSSSCDEDSLSVCSCLPNEQLIDPSSLQYTKSFCYIACSRIK